MLSLQTIVHVNINAHSSHFFSVGIKLLVKSYMKQYSAVVLCFYCSDAEPSFYFVASAQVTAEKQGQGDVRASATRWQ